MATEATLALRLIMSFCFRPTERIIQVGGQPHIRPARQQFKARMQKAGFTSGKSYRRYRLALRRDYADEAELQRNHDEYQAAIDIIMRGSLTSLSDEG